MLESDRAAAAFEELRAGIAPQIRRPAEATIQRLSVRRRRRRMRAVASGMAAMMAVAFAVSVQRFEPPVTPTPSGKPSATAEPTAEPTPTPAMSESPSSDPASAPPVGQPSSGQCSTRGVLRPGAPSGDFSVYTVKLINVVCPGVRVRVLWATYSATDYSTPSEVQTLYRQGTVYLDRDRTTLTFPLASPATCWRGYVGYGNVSAPSVINGPVPPGNDLGNLGSMSHNC